MVRDVGLVFGTVLDNIVFSRMCVEIIYIEIIIKIEFFGSGREVHADTAFVTTNNPVEYARGPHNHSRTIVV